MLYHDYLFRSTEKQFEWTTEGLRKVRLEKLLNRWSRIISRQIALQGFRGDVDREAIGPAVMSLDWLFVQTLLRTGVSLAEDYVSQGFGNDKFWCYGYGL